LTAVLDAIVVELVVLVLSEILDCRLAGVTARAVSEPVCVSALVASSSRPWTVVLPAGVAFTQALPFQIFTPTGVRLVSSQTSPVLLPLLPPAGGLTFGAVVPTWTGPTLIMLVPVESLKKSPGDAALVFSAI